MLIKFAKYIISSPLVDNCPTPDINEFAFIGRSNVGKSSLINMLCNNDRLAKTSGTPGKTQLINHFEIFGAKENTATSSKIIQPVTRWYLVDLPGYGFAKVSIRSRRRWEQMIEGYLRKRTNLKMIFVLLDARHTPQQIDLDFLSQLDNWGLPITLVFTKADKEKQAVVAKNVKLFIEKLRQSWQFIPQHFVTSATKKLGRDKILSLIEEINEKQQ